MKVKQLSNCPTVRLSLSSFYNFTSSNHNCRQQLSCCQILPATHAARVSYSCSCLLPVASCKLLPCAQLPHPRLKLSLCLNLCLACCQQRLAHSSMADNALIFSDKQISCNKKPLPQKLRQFAETGRDSAFAAAARIVRSATWRF